VRIAFDVSPLSHPRTGVGNYIRGSLAGLVEAAGSEHEVVAFAPTSPQGKRRIPEALAGIPVEPRLRFLPFAHHWRQGWSRAAWPPVERFLGPIDVLHFSDWMYPPQRSGIRSTMIHDLVPLRFPEWVQGRTKRMHGAKYRNAARTCDVVFVNSTQGQAAAAGVSQYAITKHALRAMADSLRAELSNTGVRVCSIFPGRTDTPMQQKIFELEGRPWQPDCLLRPDDVADLVAHTLAMPARAQVTELTVWPTYRP